MPSVLSSLILLRASNVTRPIKFGFRYDMHPQLVQGRAPSAGFPPVKELHHQRDINRRLSRRLSSCLSQAEPSEDPDDILEVCA